MFLFNFLTYIKFRTKKWAKLNFRKRLKYFNKMEQIMAKKEKRPVYTVVSQNLEENVNGLCKYNSKVICLNKKFLIENDLQFFGLATLFHEERHAEQNYIVSTKKKFFKLSKSYRWKKNMEAYISYNNKDKYSYYSMQEIERDANKNAIKKLQKLRFYFNNDNLYNFTLNLKIKQFDDVKNLAKKELGFFYRIKLLLREKKEQRKIK